ncbi:MAG: hypothetical protein ACOCRX_03945 [Candidatus Woesearchaeota archaeon]
MNKIYGTHTEWIEIGEPFEMVLTDKEKKSPKYKILEEYDEYPIGTHCLVQEMKKVKESNDY